MTYPSGKKNILITGGAGFIGSHLCDELVKENHIICVDNFITGSQRNIDHLLKNANFKFIKHDISQVLDFEKFPELLGFKVKLQGVQEIYNLACPTSPARYKELPIETLLANSYGTHQILEVAKNYQARFLHLSSSAIYGDLEDVQSVREDNWGHVDPIGPRSCYNEGKRFAESLVVNYYAKFGVDAKIARVFNTFGPRMKLDDGRMIPDFIVSALQEKPVVVYGTEAEIGSYCYIEDLIDGLVKLMASDVNTPVNLGSDHPVRLVDVAKAVIDLSDSKSKIEFREHLPYTAKQLIPDIALAKEQLGWFPMLALEDGLAKTIEDMRVHLREFSG